MAFSLASLSTYIYLEMASLSTSVEYQLLKTFKGIVSDSVNALEFTSDGRYLAAGSEDGSVCVWNTRSGRLTRHYAREPSSVEALCWIERPNSPRVLLVGLRDGRVLRYERPARCIVRGDSISNLR